MPELNELCFRENEELIVEFKEFERPFDGWGIARRKQNRLERGLVPLSFLRFQLSPEALEVESLPSADPTAEPTESLADPVIVMDEVAGTHDLTKHERKSSDALMETVCACDESTPEGLRPDDRARCSSLQLGSSSFIQDFGVVQPNQARKWETSVSCTIQDEFFHIDVSIVAVVPEC